MYFEQFRCGGDRNFGYLLADLDIGKCAVIDPSPDPDALIRAVKDRGLEIIYIINTHDHYDHTGGNSRVKAISKARLVLHSSSPMAELKVDEGDVLSVGSLKLEILHTPGHTGDSISILAERRLITGDFLFVGKIGGTIGRENALIQFNNLKRVMALDSGITIWPGHDVGVRPSSTIGEERKNNPFCMRLDDFEEFYYLKEHWAEYKRKHNIE